MMLEALVIVFAALVAAGTFLFVLQPVLTHSVQVSDDEETVETLEELYAQRDALYRSIKELEFDYRVGKLTDEDYKRFVTELKRQAADVLRRIDEVKAAQTSVRERLEERIRALRQGTAATMPTAPAVATVSVEDGEAQGPRFCPQCGAPVRPGDKFCSQCGTRLR